VLLGEATHGSAEFYRTRAAISKRLIEERGFDAIAVEADWPDALRISRHIAGRSEPTTEAALGDFVRFPRWMWRNTEVRELVEWLHARNAQRAPVDRVGFFGLDLYSLRSSMHAVVDYLSRVDPEAARQARNRYACFDHMAEDPQRYGYSAHFGMKKDCEDEVVRQLLDLSERAMQAVASAGSEHADELFYAQQNARVAQNAEAYYRAMFGGRNESWNLRDTHMADTLDALREHIAARKGRPARIVVWAHNSHIGDARAMEMGWDGQVNLGQLVRERIKDCFLLGFSTHHGTVTAASEWDGPAETKMVRPGMPDSIEALMHQVGMKRFVMPLGRHCGLQEMGAGRLLERAIGVLYLPQSERISHYFEAEVARQFDALLHIDETTALQPLDRESVIAEPQSEETYPTGL
ncbi:erythromycin esterase family protein, partial [Oxalobacteraceae bacterium OM1]